MDPNVQFKCSVTVLLVWMFYTFQLLASACKYHIWAIISLAIVWLAEVYRLEFCDSK